MKICHIITRYVRGGADQNTLFSCNGQAEAGHEVHFLFGNDAYAEMILAISDKVKWLQVMSLRRAINPITDLIALWKITLYLRKHRFDVVHTHASKAGVLGRLAAFFAGTPVIIHSIHILPFINVGIIQRNLYVIIERILAKITDAFICVGQGMRDAALANRVGQPCQHHVIESGMDLSKFQNAARMCLDWRTVISENSVTPVVGGEPRFLLLVSRLEPRKRQAQFLEIFAQIVKENPSVRLLLAGEGPDEARLKRLISELNLEGKAVICGYREDIEKLMAISEIGLLTSEREGLARVLIQYALVGIPIISTDIPGVREIVQPGDTGLLVPAYELNKMQLLIGELLNNRGLCVKIRQNQARIGFDMWSVTKMNVRILDLYHDRLRLAKRKR